MKFFKDNMSYLILIFTFIIFNVIHLLNQGLYWDDWWLYGLEYDDRVELFRQAGFAYFGHIHGFILSQKNYIVLYRLLFLLFSLVSAIGFFRLLRKIYSENISFLCAMVFILIPFNEPRVIAICISYSLNLALFFVAANLYFKEQRVYKIISLLIFGYSFVTGSLFFMYGLMLLIFLKASYRHDWLTNGAILEFIKKNIAFVLLPFLYLFAKFYLFPKAYGEYSNYNQVRLSYNLIIDPLLIFIKMLKKSFDLKFFAAGMLVALLIYLVMKVRKKVIPLELPKEPLIDTLIFSIIGFTMAVVPYLLVGRTAASFGVEWSARDELLMPLAFSFILVFIYKVMQKLNNILSLYFTVGLLLMFGIKTLQYQTHFLQDMIKQDAIIFYWKYSNEMSDVYTFQFIDKVAHYSIFNRSFGNSELHGMAQGAFGKQNRYITLIEDVINVCPEKLKIGILCKYWIRDDLQKKFIVDSSNKYLDRISALRLAVKKITDQDYYRSNIQQYFQFKLKDIK